MRHYLIFTTLISLLSLQASAAQKPKLVVNIVVSQMRYDYLSRLGTNLGDDGFKRFAKEGTVCNEAYYNFMQTITPATLATITTGTNPSVHGVASNRWIDYTNNKSVQLIEDPAVTGLDCDAGRGQFSPVNLTVPTLSDKLLVESPKSRVVTIAIDPTSAVVMGGNSGNTYWMDESRGTWISSSYYMKQLPEWVGKYNALQVARQYLEYNWTPLKHRESYVNNVSTLFESEQTNARKRKVFDFFKKKYLSRDYQRIPYTPAGNTLVSEFARQAIVYEDLGKDSHTDILNICYDSPRLVAQTLGGESVEFEDMFYRLDTEISELLAFIFAQRSPSDVLVVLTSDHGASDAYDNGDQPNERFNTDQFRVIVNGFMSAQYGQGEWVLDYNDRQLYLNRNLMYSNKLSISEVQERVAAFALQFRGVAHAVTSTAMQSSYFGSGYGQRVQNSFYPKRSGDVTINLMPGWIEEREGNRSLSGSMYEYDTHVPLMLIGAGMPTQSIRMAVDMKDVAPTLARIMQISNPVAATGVPIEQITVNFE